MGIATATLVGNLTGDPRGNDGQTVCNLRIAVNTRRKVDDEWTDVANYFDVVVLGGRARSCLEYLKKGRQVAVSGRLQWREWEKDGVKRQSVEILADEVMFIGGRDEDPAPQPSSSDETGW